MLDLSVGPEAVQIVPNHPSESTSFKIKLEESDDVEVKNEPINEEPMDSSQCSIKFGSENALMDVNGSSLVPEAVQIVLRCCVSRPACCWSGHTPTSTSAPTVERLPRPSPRPGTWIVTMYLSSLSCDTCG